MTIYNLAIMGFGNAAVAFVKILIEKEAALLAQGIQINITATTTGSRGNLVCPTGLDKRALLDHYSGKAPHSLGQYASQDSTLEIIGSAGYDILIEITPLNIFSGEPAITHISTALARGKHVITANKGPIAWAYSKLANLAVSNQVQFLYETTVMDGTPIFNLVKHTLPMCQVTEIKGILNTTTNFILCELEKGVPYAEILEEGLRRGFVEADPTMDTHGYDAVAKITALANVLMDADITPDQVSRNGIETITLEDINLAKQAGQTIKLIAHAKREGDKIVAFVKPTWLPSGHIYANIDATSSIVSITTDLMGEVSVIEHNPEIEQTGYGLFSDLMTLISGTTS